MISREVLSQYLTLKGVTNTLDYCRVIFYARQMKHKELSKLSEPDFNSFIKNFSTKKGKKK